MLLIIRRVCYWSAGVGKRQEAFMCCRRAAADGFVGRSVHVQTNVWTSRRVWILYVTFWSVCASLSVCECVCVRVRASAGGGAGISTQNHVRAVTSRAEIGLVSPVIRRWGERGKRRKLEERKRLFHHRHLHLLPSPPPP